MVLIGLCCALLGQTAAAAQKPELVAQLGHSTAVKSAAYSPDGTRVVTASWDGTARIWDAATGKEIRRLEGHSEMVRSAAFSPDGTRVVTAGVDGTARIWDAGTGKEIRRLGGHSASLWSAAFSPDGTSVVTGSEDGTARIWDAATGKEIRRLEGHLNSVLSAGFSPDGTRVVTTGVDGTTRIWKAATGKEIMLLAGGLGGGRSAAFSPDGQTIVTAKVEAVIWDAATGKEIMRLTGHSASAWTAAFSTDGMSVVTASLDRTARIWDVATGKETRRLEGHSSSVLSAAFSPDGTSVVTASQDGTARIWEAATGKEVRRLERRSNSVLSAAFSPDGKAIVTACGDHAARIWDAATGKGVMRLEGHSSSVLSAAFSPDGKAIVTTSNDYTARIWDAATGKEVRRLEGDPNWFESAAFSPDGETIVTAGADGTARIWDAETGKEVRRLEGHWDWVNSAAFSPDGKAIVTTSNDHTARIWDAGTGKEVKRLEGHSGAVWSAAFSPDGTRVVSASQDGTARIWDAGTGKEVRRLEGHSEYVFSAAFFPDGTRVVTASEDGTARIWDAETGKEVRRLEGHTHWVTSAALSTDGKAIITVGRDGTTRIWDAESGEEICQLISFRDGTWAVVDPEGRFDASNGGDVEGLHWVVGNEPIELSQLKERYYEPGLLGKLMGVNDEPLLDVAPFDHLDPFPETECSITGDEEPVLNIHVRNRGGGIGKVQVFLNGKEVFVSYGETEARAGAAVHDPDAESLDIRLELAGYQQFAVPGEVNAIEVKAFNGKGIVSSRPVRLPDYAPEGVTQPPHFWAIVAGVSNYRGEEIELDLPDDDAEAMAQALEAGAGRLFGDDHVHISLLTTGNAPGARTPTKANLTAAFEEVRLAAKSTDILVVYLAGHGVTTGRANGEYYYLTQGARSTAGLEDPDVRDAVALSSKELADLMIAVPANKQVLILDTCAAGQAVETLTEARAVSSSAKRAWERMKDRSGMFVLAGCAADAASYEASRYGQGLLTYSLLLGMKGGGLRGGSFVDVMNWFQFARDTVPQLARNIGSVQQPVIATRRDASSFDIGQFDAEGRNRIPLGEELPMVMRSAFQDEERIRDHLGVARSLDEALDALSSRADRPPLVFVDANPDLADAFSVVGRYKVDGDKVVVSVRVFLGTDLKDQFQIEGSANEIQDLAQKILSRLLETFYKGPATLHLDSGFVPIETAVRSGRLNGEPEGGLRRTVGTWERRP